MTGDQNGGVPPQPPRPSFGGNLRAALKVTGLSRTAKLILVCIAAHANEDGENSRTSYATMAVAGECSRRYAMLICEQLRHDGLITLTCPGRRGRGLDAPNTFALNVEKLLERQHSRGDLQSSPQTKSRGDLQSSPQRKLRGDLQSSPLEIRGDLQSSPLQICNSDLQSSPLKFRGDLQSSPDPREEIQIQDLDPPTVLGNQDQGSSTVGPPAAPSPTNGKSESPPPVAVTVRLATPLPFQRGESPPNARSKHPVFKGQRFVVFDWQLDDLMRLLGAHADDFGLDAWFYELDARALQSGAVIPQRDKGVWLQEQTLAEAQRRGLPVMVTTTKQTLTQRMAALVASSRGVVQ